MPLIFRTMLSGQFWTLPAFGCDRFLISTVEDTVRGMRCIKVRMGGRLSKEIDQLKPVPLSWSNDFTKCAIDDLIG